MLKHIPLISTFVLSTGLLGGAQSVVPPFIEFGAARVALGMSQEQVEMNLSKSGRRLSFLSFPNDPPTTTVSLVFPDGNQTKSEGQVTFSNKRVIYVAYDFPTAHSAVELAQEVAGAIATLENKVCVASNFSSQSTGGSYTQSSLDCGAKSLVVITSEVFGEQRTSAVKLTIGSVATK